MVSPAGSRKKNAFTVSLARYFVPLNTIQFGPVPGTIYHQFLEFVLVWHPPPAAPYYCSSIICVVLISRCHSISLLD